MNLPNIPPSVATSEKGGLNLIVAVCRKINMIIQAQVMANHEQVDKQPLIAIVAQNSNTLLSKCFRNEMLLESSTKSIFVISQWFSLQITPIKYILI